MSRARRVARGRVTAGALALALLPGSTTAQTAGAQASAPEVTLSADSVAIGDAFELRVTLVVPPGSTVHFPDTLPATDALVSLERVRWEAVPAQDGGALLTVAYPLIAFRAGIVPVPGLDLLVGPLRPGGEAAPLPGGSTVGPWADAPAALAAATPGAVRRWRIARRGVRVAPPFTPAELAADPLPKPADDVLGGSWHWPSLSLALLLSAVLAGVLVETVRDERRARRRDATPEGEGPLGAAAALAALDRLLADAPHRHGRVRELYARASAIVRRYVESTDARWGPDLTATELMGLLARKLRPALTEGAPHGGGAPVPAPPGAAPPVAAPMGAATTGAPEADEALFGAMAAAEAAKFAPVEPTAAAAEAHARALRDWIALRVGADGEGPA